MRKVTKVNKALIQKAPVFAFGYAEAGKGTEAEGRSKKRWSKAYKPASSIRHHQQQVEL